MPFLRDDILNPIAGTYPGGKNIRYDPLQIKLNEARREDDDAPAGDWVRERKVADHKGVIKIGAEAIATKSKDLWIAAWVTESLLKTQGFAGFLEGLQLCKGILETFWDDCYPLFAPRNPDTDDEEDGDPELRAAPLEAVASTKMVMWLKMAPFTKAGGFFRYKESRGVGYEADAADSDDKQARRSQAIEDGKLTAEDWDAAENETSTEVLKGHLATLDQSIETLDGLESLCQDKFGDDAPGFTVLRDGITEIRHTINVIVRKRGEEDTPKQEEEPAEETVAADDGWSTPETTEEAPKPVKKKAGGAISLEPQDMDEIAPRLEAIARFMRAQDAYSPAPYLMLRGYRWGELRSYGSSPDPRQLLAPPSSIREKIKLLALDGNWAEMLEAAESAMAGPGGRAWLDLQRWVVRACENLGYSAIAEAIKSEVRALVTDLPDLTGMTLMDDSPCANAETRQWLDEFAKPAPAMQESAAPAAVDDWNSPQADMEESSEASDSGEPKPPDAYELANEQVRWGNVGEAVKIMMREIQQQPSGRSKFQRRVQLAYILTTNSHEKMAQPILEQLMGEIDAHRLEDWENGEMLAHPLAMLYKCLGRSEDADFKHKLYNRIARLDPVQALNCSR